MPYTPLPPGGGSSGIIDAPLDAAGTSAGNPELVRVYRRVRTKTASLGYTVSEQQIAGSPFYAHFYWISPTAAAVRDEAPPGVATIDRHLGCRFLSTQIDVRVGDILVRVSDSMRALVVRSRILQGARQCEMEAGAI